MTLCTKGVNMAFEHNGVSYIEPQDLKIKTIDFLPKVPVNDDALKNELGRDFLGPDEVVALIQVAVSRSVDYQTGLEEELLKMMADGRNIKESIFKKNLSGIGRGHSLDGLPVIALGLNGTKMIDSAFTGMVYSRSLVTSGRRRETPLAELVIPRSISADTELLKEYIKISADLFAVSGEIKQKFAKKTDAIQAFNKLKPYNDPADLFYVLPLSSLGNLAKTVDAEKAAGTSWLPEEFAIFAGIMEEKADYMGMGQLFRMRKAVPRETYLHYNIFKAPVADYVGAMHERLGCPVNPAVVRIVNDLPEAAEKELAELKTMMESVSQYAGPEALYVRACRNQRVLSNICRNYNEALNIQTISSLSWRVWSEQKRHATLRQHVESIYTAADRAYRVVREIWPAIQNKGDINTIAAAAENAFVISPEIKDEPELLEAYIYNTARQIMFYGRLVDSGVPLRDALYVVPRNIRLRTLESYDLINAISLELPLRLCTECEPERRMTSEEKAVLLKEMLPELSFLFESKCNIGYCTEGRFCAKIMKLNPRYNMETHKAIAAIIAGM